MKERRRAWRKRRLLIRSRHVKVIVIQFALFYLMIGHAIAQNVSLSLHDLDFLNFPEISGMLCIEDTSGRHFYADSASITISQNGIPLSFQIHCPLPGETLSLVQVIDASGSMLSRIGPVRDAASMLIDSMRNGDEMAVIEFNTQMVLLQDFTSDRTALKFSLQNIFPRGGTALYDAISRSIDLVAVRAGRKVLVVISDGADNQSITSLDETIAKAKSQGAIVFTIGIGADSVPEQDLIRLARETGGRFYTGIWPSEIVSIFEELTQVVYSLCCSISFTSSGCTDSLPSVFHLTYNRGDVSAEADTALTLPWRPDRIQLTMSSPPPRLFPGDDVILYLRLMQAISQSIPLEYTFEVKYNPDLLELRPDRAITIGTMTQGKIATVRAIAAGRISVHANAFYPAYPSGNLVGLRFVALAGDSSRRTPVEILDPVFIQGCENTVEPVGATVEVCQCEEILPMDYSFPSPVYSSGQYAMRIVVPPEALDIPAIFRGEISYRAEYLRPLQVRNTEGSDIPWEITGKGRLRIPDTWQKFYPADSTLLVVVWEVTKPKYSRKVELGVTGITLWSNCCYTFNQDTSSSILVEGSCDRIARRKSTVRLYPAFPNPANPTCVITFDVLPDVSGGNADRSIVVEVYTQSGQNVGTIVDGMFHEGKYTVPFFTGNLSSGRYFIVLRSGDIRLCQMLTVVK